MELKIQEFQNNFDLNTKKLKEYDSKLNNNSFINEKINQYAKEYLNPKIEDDF